MVKAEKPKAKPKPKFTDKAQSERFIETARQLVAEETSERFNLFLDQLLQTKPNKGKPG